MQIKTGKQPHLTGVSEGTDDRTACGRVNSNDPTHARGEIYTFVVMLFITATKGQQTTVMSRCTKQKAHKIRLRTMNKLGLIVPTRRNLKNVMLRKQKQIPEGHT